MITADKLIAHVEALSADAFAGRGPASDGDRMTQAYLARELEALGYQPAAADGSWLQTFDLVGIDPSVPESWSFSAGGEHARVRPLGRFRRDQRIANRPRGNR